MEFKNIFKLFGPFIEYVPSKVAPFFVSLYLPRQLNFITVSSNVKDSCFQVFYPLSNCCYDN